MLRHSSAHLLAQAVTDVFPGAQYAIGPAIEDGFYYDFQLSDDGRFTDDDLERIAARMREIVAEDQPFERDEMTRDEGLALFADQPYKQEIIERVDASRGGGGHRHLGVPQPSTGWPHLRRPLPRAPRAEHRPSGRVPAHAGRRRLLAR